MDKCYTYSCHPMNCALEFNYKLKELSLAHPYHRYFCDLVMCFNHKLSFAEHVSSR